MQSLFALVLDLHAACNKHLWHKFCVLLKRMFFKFYFSLEKLPYDAVRAKGTLVVINCQRIIVKYEEITKK